MSGSCLIQRENTAKLTAKQIFLYYETTPGGFEYGYEIIIHGTGDDWVDTDTVMRECKKRGIPLFLTEKANHSLEVGDVRKGLENLCMIMEKTERYIREFTNSYCPFYAING